MAGISQDTGGELRPVASVFPVLQVSFWNSNIYVPSLYV